MNLTEILNAQGITEEVANAILAAMRENKIFTASEENLDIRYGKLKTDHEGVKQQLGQANATIEDQLFGILFTPFPGCVLINASEIARDPKIHMAQQKLICTFAFRMA